MNINLKSRNCQPLTYRFFNFFVEFENVYQNFWKLILKGYGPRDVHGSSLMVAERFEDKRFGLSGDCGLPVQCNSNQMVSFSTCTCATCMINSVLNNQSLMCMKLYASNIHIQVYMKKYLTCPLGWNYSNSLPFS